MSHRELLERHRRVMAPWMILYYDQPIELVSGNGRTVRDREGREYLDFFGGILTTMVGHAVPEIVGAIKDQADRILHTSSLYLIEPQITLAERIAELSGIPDARVYLTTSGTDANDAAILLATAYRRSNQVLALRHSYHGSSYAATAITGIASWSPTSLSPLQVTYVHGGYRLRSPFRDQPDEEYISSCVWDLQNLVEVSTSGDVACMIAEPVQGVGGFITPPDGMLGAMKEVLDEHQILFISDEVQTGWGRTGEHFWGYQAHDIVPDMLTFAKGIGNGLSIGGVVARAEIMESVKHGPFATFGGNPLCTAGAVATLDYLIEHDLQGNAHAMGSVLATRLEALAQRTPEVVDVRGKGLMYGIEVADPESLEPDREGAAKLMEATREELLLVGRGGAYGNVLRVAPPMTVTEAEVNEACDRLDRAFATVYATSAKG